MVRRYQEMLTSRLRGSQSLQRARLWKSRRGTIYSMLGLFLLLAASCASSNSPPTLTLSGADKGKTFQVNQNDMVILSLPENPSTGFRWAIDRTDNSILQLQNSDFTPTPNAMPGSGGTRVFTFKAIRTGMVQLQLKRWRDWEGDSSIVERYNVTITVQG